MTTTHDSILTALTEVLPRTSLHIQSNLTRSTRRAPAVPEIVHDETNVQTLVDVDSPHVSSVPSDFSSQPIKTETQAERVHLEHEAHKKAHEAKHKAHEAKRKAESKAEKAKKTLKNNTDHPVILGNAVTIAALGGLLGFGAYRKYAAGELTWKVAGLWAGAVGLFGVADYYVSQ